MENDSFLKRVQDLEVEEFTTPCALSVSPETSLEEAEKFMEKEEIRHLPVLHEKRVAGVISARDIAVAKSAAKAAYGRNLLVKDYMSKNPYCVSPSAKLSEVALQMSANKYGSAVIIGEDGEIGIFTCIDALNALVEIARGEL